MIRLKIGLRVGSSVVIEFAWYTYYCMVKGSLRAHSLPIIMLNPDSRYEKHIKTF